MSLKVVDKICLSIIVYPSKTTKFEFEANGCGELICFYCKSLTPNEMLQLLEQIDQDIQQKNPYIKIPVKLEQSLIEGAYHKVSIFK